MIYTEISNIGHYHGLGKYLDEAVDYLSSHPLEDVQAGHYEIDGNKVYMNVFDYDTISEDGAFFEAHKKYADIHMTVTGEEIVGVSDMSKVSVKTFDEEKDLLEVEGPVEHYIKLIPGKALITLPEDAHKVKLAVGNPSAVKKAVIKVYVG
ncbi:MAG: YhcH/YjgK/YiaL family protein [Lachnospiraceae bacterium]|nr:YhcH/YjgK/YiaL family protein [Lachnospiraceae bacterium]HBV82450.1 YhcH/YjgK/YiaL family protein [Lachnospiraceae bacterium]